MQSHFCPLAGGSEAGCAGHLKKEYFTEQEVEAVFGLTCAYLRKRRNYGDGPTYRKIGRKVLYPRVEVEAWLDARTRTSTSDDGRGA